MKNKKIAIIVLALIVIIAAIIACVFNQKPRTPFPVPRQQPFRRAEKRSRHLVVVNALRHPPQEKQQEGGIDPEEILFIVKKGCRHERKFRRSCRASVRRPAWATP